MFAVYDTNDLVGNYRKILCVQSLGELVKAWREASGLSQTDLARRAGVKYQNIQQLENGKAKQPRYLAALAKAMGASVDDLLARRMPTPTSPGPNDDQQLSGLTLVNEPAPAEYLASSTSVPLIVRQLAALMAKQDEPTRAAVASLLSLLANQPRDHVKISQAIQALVGRTDEPLSAEEPAHREGNSWAGIDRRTRNVPVERERRSARVIDDRQAGEAPARGPKRING
jgi:transcriptional regulator with XRE-family HTH domain